MNKLIFNHTVIQQSLEGGASLLIIFLVYDNYKEKEKEGYDRKENKDEESST